MNGVLHEHEIWNISHSLTFFSRLQGECECPLFLACLRLNYKRELSGICGVIWITKYHILLLNVKN